MAVVRCCLRRAFEGFSTRICNKYQYLVPGSFKFQHLEHPWSLPRLYSSYRSSPYVEELNSLTDFEVIDSPEQWKYVERLLPIKTVPKPVPKDEYPSGWKPQDPACIDQPYYIGRTKNHIMPVYVMQFSRGQRKITDIKRIQGDIWKLAEEIRTFLVKKHNRVISLRVHELCGDIQIKGDFALDVRGFLLKKGF